MGFAGLAEWRRLQEEEERRRAGERTAQEQYQAERNIQWRRNYDAGQQTTPNVTVPTRPAVSRPLVGDSSPARRDNIIQAMTQITNPSAPVNTGVPEIGATDTMGGTRQTEIAPVRLNPTNQPMIWRRDYQPQEPVVYRSPETPQTPQDERNVSQRTSGGTQPVSGPGGLPVGFATPLTNVPAFLGNLVNQDSLNAVQRGVEHVGRTISEGLAGAGENISNTIDLLGNTTLRELIPTEEEYRANPTPTGAVWERYRQKTETEATGAQALVEQYIPIAKDIGDVLNAVGAVGEAFVATDLGAIQNKVTQKYVDWGLMDEPTQNDYHSIGEEWATLAGGWAAMQKMDEMEAAAADRTGAGQFDENFRDFLDDPGGYTKQRWDKFVGAMYTINNNLNTLADELTPEQVKLVQADPTLMPLALAEARSMFHHGPAAPNEQFDDILEIDERARQARAEAARLYEFANTLPAGPDQEQALWRAAEAGEVASRLENKNTLQIFDENADWRYALPAELIFDPFMLVDGVTDLLRIAPKARRIAQGRKWWDLTVEAAERAFAQGGKETSNTAWIKNLLNIDQTRRSQSYVDIRNTARSLSHILRGFDHKEDLRRILKTLAIDPEALMRGIPLSEFKSPGAWLQQVEDGVIRFNKAANVDKRFMNSLPALKRVSHLINTLPSLQGEGVANLIEVQAELRQLLTLGAADFRNVLSSATIFPPQAKEAKITLSAGGEAIVEYLGPRSQSLGKTASMTAAEANQLVKDFNNYIKSGSVYQTNWARFVGDLERRVFGTTTLNAPWNVQSIINNGFSGRMVAALDGVYSISNLDNRVKWAQNVFEGMLQDEDILVHAGQEIEQLGSFVSREWSRSKQWRAGAFDWVRNARNADETRMKAGVKTKVLWDEMNEGVMHSLLPDIQRQLSDMGITDPKDLRFLAQAIATEGLHKGGTAMRKMFADIVQGRQRLNLGSINPNAGDYIPPEFMERIDNILASVNTSNIAQMRQEILNIQRDLLARMDIEISKYGPTLPGRNWWTRHEMQQEAAELKEMLKGIGQHSGININIEDEIRKLSQTQEDVNKSFRTLFQLGATDAGITPYIYGTWERLQELRMETRAAVDSAADWARKQLPQDQGLAWELYHQQRAAEWRKYSQDARELINDTAQFITAGLWKEPGNITRMGISDVFDMQGMLNDLGYDALQVFEEGAALKGLKGASATAQRSSVIQAGRNGLDKFAAMMNIALQQAMKGDAFDSGIDHYMSAINDVSDYFRAVIRPAMAEGDAIWKPIRDAERAAELAAIAAQKTPQEVAQAILDAVPMAQRVAAKKKYHAVLDPAWQDYYNFAYSRYQAGSMFIMQPTLQSVNNISFTPLNNWGATLTGGQPVKFLGFDLSNPKKVWVQFGSGKRMSMPIKNMEPGMLKIVRDIYADGEKQLANEVGKIGARLFSEGTGADEIDKMIDSVRNGGYKEIYDQVRLNVADFIMNHKSAPPMSGNVEREFRRQFRNIMGGIMGSLDQVASYNSKSARVGGLEAIGQFNETIGRKFDNILYGAQRSAEEMSSFSLVDFINEYNSADVVLGIFAPYLYWATRHGKNAIERAIFKPAAISKAIKVNQAMESNARAEGLPDRAKHSIGTGIMDDLGNEYRIPINLGRWFPVDPRQVFNGWANPQRANQALEYVTDLMEDSENPSLSKGLLGAGTFAREFAGALGINVYPWWEMVGMWGEGRGNEASFADIGMAGSLGGHAVQKFTGQVVPGITSFTAPYLAGRMIRDQASRVELQINRGEQPSGPLVEGATLRQLDPGEYAQVLIAVIQAQAQGHELDPRFLAKYPWAVEDATPWIRESANQGILRAMVGAFTGFTPQIVNEGELQYMQDRDKRNAMYYDPATNPQGAREANQVYEQESENYNPGLAANTALSDVLPDEPNDPYPSERIDQKLVGNEYYDKRDALYAEVAEAQEAFLAEHGGADAVAADYDLRTEYAKINDGLYDRVQALEEEYAGYIGEYEFDASKLRGANPIEIRNAAIDQLLRQAKAEHADIMPEVLTAEQKATLPRSERKANSDAWEVYNAKVEQTFNELMADPRAASNAVFGLPLPTNDGGYIVDPTLQQQESVEDGPVLPLDGTLMTPEGMPVDPGVEIPPVEQPVLPGTPESAPNPAAPMLVDNTPVVIPGDRPKSGDAPRQAPLPPTAQVTQPQTYPASKGNKWGEQMMAAESEYGLPMGILDGLAKNESNFDPNAVGGNGVGILQFEPAAWNDAIAAGVIPADAKRTDPEASIIAAAWYLNWINENLPPDKQGDFRWVLAAYNQGIGRVIPMKSMEDVAAVQAATVPYIERILAGTQEKQAELQPTVTNDLALPVENMRVTQQFGNPGQHYSNAGFRGHEGVDFGAYEGAPIYSVAGGTVVTAGDMTGTGNSAYGNLVVVDHGNGYKTYYAHLSGVNVNVGDVVEPGQLVGAMGNTGYSDGTHLHFGIQDTNNRNNGYKGFVDPMPYLNGEKAWPGGGGLLMPVEKRDAQLAEEHEHLDEKLADHTQDVNTPMGGEDPGAIDWGVQGSGSSLYDQVSSANDSEAEQQMNAATNQFFAEQDARVQSAYPEYAYLLDEWQGTDDEDRPAFRARNPEIRAVNLIANFPEAHDYITQTWGEDAVMRYARTPESEAAGGAPGARREYYRNDPDAFLIRSWLNGRPEPFDDTDEGKSDWDGYDQGQDYELAKQKFGEDIWDIVRIYYQLPPSTPGNAEIQAQRREFYETYPQYTQWSDWWWANLKDGESKGQTGQGSGYYGGSRGWYGGGSGSGGDYYGGADAPNYYSVNVSDTAPAQYRPPSGAGDLSGWRRWLSLNETELRSWRR